jgi:pimeloyl-ACP methyl ester carboxylesterase
VDYLKSRKEIDPRKIGLVGHSEGGLIAPMAAGQSSDVAFIVLMAGPGVSGREVLLEQARLIGRSMGTPEALLDKNSEVQKKIFAILDSAVDTATAESQIKQALSTIEGMPEGAMGGQLAMALSPWFRYFVHYDPQAALQKIRCPVLAINGEKDLQVPPRQNLPAIERALRASGNKDFKMVELPGLNHLFQTCKTGAVAEYRQIEETMAPAALDLIARWILQHSR